MGLALAQEGCNTPREDGNRRMHELVQYQDQKRLVCKVIILSFFLTVHSHLLEREIHVIHVLENYLGGLNVTPHSRPVPTYNFMKQ